MDVPRTFHELTKHTVDTRVRHIEGRPVFLLDGNACDEPTLVTGRGEARRAGEDLGANSAAAPRGALSEGTRIRLAEDGAGPQAALVAGGLAASTPARSGPGT